MSTLCSTTWVQADEETVYEQTIEDIDIKQVINAVKLERKAPLPPKA
jgi:hypothetical protein